jgi:hypothetical protein
VNPEDVPHELVGLIDVESAEEWAATQDGDFDDLLARYLLAHVMPEIMEMTLEAYARVIEKHADPKQLLEWEDVPRDIRSWIENDMLLDLLED